MNSGSSAAGADRAPRPTVEGCGRGRALVPRWSRRAWLFWVPSAALGASAVKKESELRVVAIWLLHFATHTRWPAGTFASSDVPLVVGVIGRDPFGATLDEVFRGEAVSGHRVEVRRFSEKDASTGCHLLFVGEVSAPALPKLLGGVESEPVLTLSLMEGFCARGGMVAFYSGGAKVQFEIALTRVRSRRLELHSRLLGQAKTYDDRPGRP